MIYIYTICILCTYIYIYVLIIYYMTYIFYYIHDFHSSHLARALAFVTKSAMLFKTWCCMPHFHALHLPSFVSSWLSWLLFIATCCRGCALVCFNYLPSIVLQHIVHRSHSYWSHGTGESWFPSYSSTSCSRTSSFYVDDYLFTTHHRDSHSWRTCNTSTRTQRTASGCHLHTPDLAKQTSSNTFTFGTG